MAQTAPITTQLAGELLGILQRGETIGEMDAARKMRQVKGIESAEDRVIVQSLVIAARGDRDKAEAQFQKYLSDYQSSVIGAAYAAYLFRIRKLSAYFNLCLRLVEQFPFDPDVIQKGVPMLYFSGNATKCIEKSDTGADLMSSVNAKAAEEFRMTGHNWAKNIEAAQEASGASTPELKVLSETVMEVLEKYKSYPADYIYYPMFNDGSAALIAITDIAEPEKIADMNFDLAMALATKDELQTSNLTAWFECKKKIQKEA